MSQNARAAYMLRYKLLTLFLTTLYVSSRIIMQSVLNATICMEANQIALQASLCVDSLINHEVLLWIFWIIQVSIWRALLLSWYPPQTNQFIKRPWFLHKPFLFLLRHFLRYNFNTFLGIEMFNSWTL